MYQYFFIPNEVYHIKPTDIIHHIVQEKNTINQSKTTTTYTPIQKMDSSYQKDLRGIGSQLI